MHAHVVLRKIAATASQLIHLREGFFGGRDGLGGDDDARTDTGTIGFRAYEFDLDPGAVEGGIAPQQLRNGVDAIDRDIEIAIIIIITEGATASRSVL